MDRAKLRKLGLIATLAASLLGFGEAEAGKRKAWNDPGKPLVIDAYELNAIDWQKLLTDKRIAGFIHKASDGLPESYTCIGDHAGDTFAHCKTMWRKYAVSKELYQTRRLVARGAGLLWGAYHLARPGKPIDQANHFLDYAEPDEKDLMVLDIEDLGDKFMSLEDAEIFVRHIKARTGRYPILYTNHNVSRYIAARRKDYRLLSRLPIWYARYKPDIASAFPAGNWSNYFLWQFSSATNCSKRRCPYRVPGTLTDIDVNVAGVDLEELKRVWSKGELLPPVDPEPALVAEAFIPYEPY
jgi:GH25 family lysozyme M1 (1,4-beta-N-acetylmuramidase)